MSDKEIKKTKKRKAYEGAGRPKGSKNKADARIKNAWGAFLEGRLKEIDRLYSRVEDEEGAAAALKLLLDISKYAAPTTKLEREGNGGGGNYILNINTGIPMPPNSLGTIDCESEDISPSIPLPLEHVKDEHEF